MGFWEINELKYFILNSPICLLFLCSILSSKKMLWSIWFSNFDGVHFLYKDILYPLLILPYRYIHFPNIINSYYCSGVWNQDASLCYQRGCHGRFRVCDERLLWASQWDLQLLVWNGWVGIVSTLNSLKLHIFSCNESKDKVMEIGEGGAGSVRAAGFMLVSLMVIKILV